jgi:hypothetical protein
LGEGVQWSRAMHCGVYPVVKDLTQSLRGGPAAFRITPSCTSCDTRTICRQAAPSGSATVRLEKSRTVSSGCRSGLASASRHCAHQWHCSATCRHHSRDPKAKTQSIAPCCRPACSTQLPEGAAAPEGNRVICTARKWTHLAAVVSLRPSLLPVLVAHHCQPPVLTLDPTSTQPHATSHTPALQQQLRCCVQLGGWPEPS